MKGGRNIKGVNRHSRDTFATSIHRVLSLTIDIIASIEVKTHVEFMLAFGFRALKGPFFPLGGYWRTVVVFASS
jgi:hypothetical protein